MNYLNPYIALGGRNPFRACFFGELKTPNCNSEIS